MTPSPPGSMAMPPPPQRNGVRGMGVGLGGPGRGPGGGRGRGGRISAQQQQPPDSRELNGGAQRKNPGRLFQDSAPGLRCAVMLRVRDDASSQPRQVLGAAACI